MNQYHNILGNIQYLSHKADCHANQDFTRDYAYDAGNNQLNAFTVNSNIYANTYDPNGNLTQEGQSRHCEWTADDKLAVFKIQAGGGTPSVYTNYFYNSQGERVKKHTRKGNKVIVTFYMDGGMFETSYVKPTGGSIDPARHYNTLNISDGDALLATVRVGNDAEDNTPAQKFYVEDQLGSCSVAVTTSGNRINLEEYYPFGETSYGSYAKKRYRYNGKEKDEESGLYEYGQRYYAPWLCRFVSVDPVAEDYPHLSPYNYASNRPVTSVDAEGLQAPDEPKGVTDASGREALIDPKAEFVEGDTAVISQEGDKFVNVTGVGFVKESYLRTQNITPKRVDSRKRKQEIQDDSSNWFQRLFDWIPELEGSGDKSGSVKSGLTHVSEDATEIDNSGIEGKEVEGQIEIDELQYLLRGAPGKLQFGRDNWIDALSSGTDLFNEIISENEPEYDFPLPNEKTLSTALTEGNTGLDMIQVTDSINISYYKKTKSSYRVGKFIYSVEGEKIDTISGTRQDTVGGKYKGQSIIKVWKDVHK